MKVVGIIVAMLLVGVCVFLYQDGHWPDKCPCEAASPPTTPQKSSPTVVPEKAVLLAAILVGDRALESSNFADYAALCTALNGGLSGVQRCNELLEPPQPSEDAE